MIQFTEYSFAEYSKSLPKLTDVWPVKAFDTITADDIRGAWRQAGFGFLYSSYSGNKEMLSVYGEMQFGSGAKYC